MIGHFLNIKIAAKNINRWLKMIRKRKNNNNYGAKFFPFKIKIVSKIKKLLSRFSNKFIQ